MPLLRGWGLRIPTNVWVQATLHSDAHLSPPRKKRPPVPPAAGRRIAARARRTVGERVRSPNAATTAEGQGRGRGMAGRGRGTAPGPTTAITSACSSTSRGRRRGTQSSGATHVSGYWRPRRQDRLEEGPRHARRGERRAPGHREGRPGAAGDGPAPRGHRGRAAGGSDYAVWRLRGCLPETAPARCDGPETAPARATDAQRGTEAAIVPIFKAWRFVQTARSRRRAPARRPA